MLGYGVPPEFRGGAHSFFFKPSYIRHRVCPEFIGSRNYYVQIASSTAESAGKGPVNLKLILNEC